MGACSSRPSVLTLSERVILRIYLEFRRKISAAKAATLRHLSPTSYMKLVYYRRTGRRLNLSRVSDFNEKVYWLQIYWKAGIVVSCADKVSARDYVRERGLEHILVPLVGIVENPHEILDLPLPKKFVLKCSHGCGYTLFCHDKASFDFQASLRTLKRWGKSVYGQETGEYHYSAIKPRFIVEELVGGGGENLLEIQVFCINGEPVFILARNDLGASNLLFARAVTYDLSWRRIYARRGEEDIRLGFERPFMLSQIIDSSRILASPFPQVRIDFMISGEKYYFGELTFTTSGGILSNFKEDFVKELGGLLSLPSPLPHKSWSERNYPTLSNR